LSFVLISGAIPTASLYQKGSASVVPEALAAEFPFHVTDHFQEKVFAGDGESGASLDVQDNFVDPEQHCEFCTRIQYPNGAHGTSGFAFGADHSIDFSGAKVLSFWAKGEQGGEKVKFKIGGKDAADDVSKHKGIFKSKRFALSTEEVALKNDWKKYEVDLRTSDLADVTTPFGIEISKGQDSKSQVFYVKGITLDDTNPDSSLLIPTDAVATLSDQNSTDIRTNDTSRAG
jgi:hypothetical protein